MSGNLAVSTINGVDISVSTVATESKVIGVNQTWQDVTGSRAVGTTYTNSTGKPIMVSIKVNSSQDLSNIIVGGIGIGAIPNGEGAGAGAAFSFIVPNNTTYSAVAGSSSAFTAWVELR